MTFTSHARRSVRGSILCSALLGLTLTLCNPARAATAPAGEAIGAAVDSFHTGLLANMKNHAAPCASRYARLAPVVDKTFDLSFLASRVLRKHWDELNEAQRQSFVSTFRELIIDNYVTNFDDYNGESFVTGEIRDVPGGYKAVHSEMRPQQGDAVSFDYVLRNTAQGWRIVNVIAEGVSNLAVYATQYDRAYKEQGYDGLLAQVREQIDKAKSACH